MKKSTRIKNRQFRYHPIISVAALLVGVVGTIAVTQVLAQSANEMIYGCVNKTNGNVRIVAQGESCKNGETSLNWAVQGSQGIPGPTGVPGATGTSGGSFVFSCNGCVLYPVADRFKGKDLSYSQITKAEFQNSDLTGIIFKGAQLISSNFTNANLTGADFTDAGNYPGWNVNSNFDHANLTNANFTNANLQFSKNMGTANVTGAIWSNTKCPDGTNSNNNGNTCVGHF